MATSMRLCVRASVALGAIVAILFITARPAGAVDYRPPVDESTARLIDPFRPPPTPYGRGNRGLEYATARGQPVLAAGDGVVVFAGRVGFGNHVVVGHADGIRTSYSFLRDVAVRRGQRVNGGDRVGTAGPTVHIGARIGDTYIDPLRLFGRGLPPHLVDDDPPARLAHQLPARELRAHLPVAAPVCTPVGTPPPSPPADRRIALLVGGLGSATGRAAILDLDTTALGYATGDVVQFSYRGGGEPYGAADTHQDIGLSAHRLVARVRELRRLHPGVPIDLLAHSQGGLVVRAALASDPGGLDGVETIVTLGTPHGGNSLASAGALLGLPSISIGQLASGSAFISGLPSHGGTDRPRAVAIGATNDLVVPTSRSRWPGAVNVTVDLERAPTPFDHGRMTGDPAVAREVALALGGAPPTCPSPGAANRHWLAGSAVDGAQRLAGGWAVDRRSAGGRQGVPR